jgi:hypothetical protein
VFEVFQLLKGDVQEVARAARRVENTHGAKPIEEAVQHSVRVLLGGTFS